ncbi:MAG: FAD-dependent oxidoreductase, partial [Streptomyces sp.]|uniref:FAD-dependent oxidoreductase n=1 Tax=Streptomyces sp. TaxID=1931 RepID=UPI0025F19338
MKPRVVVAGLGDSGLLTAIHLSRHASVVGISAKPEIVSGQELGVRLARPEDWARDNRVDFGRYRRLDGVRRLHGSLVGLDLDARTVTVELAEGGARAEPYDVLVISTGVANGFWRTPEVQSRAQVDDDIRRHHETLAGASSIAVIGGGAAAVNTAANARVRWPDKQVDLFFPGDRAIPQHHPRAWSHVRRRLVDLGVALHPGHRAVVPDGFACDDITHEPVSWSTGQSPTHAEAVVWAIGRVQPNTSWLPISLLDAGGFVDVTSTLQTRSHPEVFAIGDVAATDPLRSSARNRADRLLARNIRAHLAGRPLKEFRPARSRWGSVLGLQDDGLLFLAPDGRAIQIPAWALHRVLLPWVVRRGFY